jgi:hypothetical protein
MLVCRPMGRDAVWCGTQDWHLPTHTALCHNLQDGNHRARAHQRNWQLQRNRNFRETSPISSMQLISRSARTHWGNLCLISCSHHLNWVCSSDWMHDCNFVRLPSAMSDNHNMAAVETAWEERTTTTRKALASLKTNYQWRCMNLRERQASWDVEERRNLYFTSLIA